MLNPDIQLINEWFRPNVNYNELIDDIISAEQLTAKLHEQDEEILKKWEKAVLDIDCNNMLHRFESEYTNIFRFFKSQYRKDRQEVRTLSRNDNDTQIVDETIVDLLNKLRERAEISDKLGNLHISDKIGSLYSGHETDWEKVRSGIRIAEKIHNLLGNDASEFYAAICVSDNIEKIKADIKDITDRINSGCVKVDELCKFNGVQCSDNYGQFLRINIKELNYLATDLNSCINELEDEIGVHYTTESDMTSILKRLYELLNQDAPLIRKWFASDTDYADLINDIINAERFTNALLHYEEKILSKWKEEVFNLEPDNMLYRFENGYKSISNLFKSLYLAKNQYITFDYSFYDGNEQTQKYTIAPWQLLYYQGMWSLYGNDLREKTGKFFNLPLISNVEVKKETFEPPEESAYLKRAKGNFGRYIGSETFNFKIRINRDVTANYIRTYKWTDDQKFEIQADGSVIMTFTSNQYYPVLNWVLSHGQWVTPLEPPKLVDEWKENVLGMMKNGGIK